MLPDFLEKKIRSYYPEQIDEIVKGYTLRRKTSFRINRLKMTEEKTVSFLYAKKVKYSRVGWYPDAFIIEQEPEEDIRKWPVYENGAIYLQSLSAMIPVLVMEPKKGENILDMCAAPGGKTTQIASMTMDRAMITACEKNRARAERLKFNLRRQGTGNVTVMNVDSRKLDDFFRFDKVLLDAPCSGSGTFSSGYVPKEFSEELIERSVRTQKEMLDKAVRITAPGGMILYSTCSILKEENENVVKNALVKGNIELLEAKMPGMDETVCLPSDLPGAITVMPSEYMEGFFVSLLRKKE